MGHIPSTPLTPPRTRVCVTFGASTAHAYKACWLYLTKTCAKAIKLAVSSSKYTVKRIFILIVHVVSLFISAKIHINIGLKHVRMSEEYRMASNNPYQTFLTQQILNGKNPDFTSPRLNNLELRSPYGGFTPTAPSGSFSFEPILRHGPGGFEVGGGFTWKI